MFKNAGADPMSPGSRASTSVAATTTSDIREQCFLERGGVKSRGQRAPLSSIDAVFNP